MCIIYIYTYIYIYIYILYVYICTVWYMDKDDAINIMKNSNLNEKVDYCIFLLHIKMSDKTTYYRKIED